MRDLMEEIIDQVKKAKLSVSYVMMRNIDYVRIYKSRNMVKRLRRLSK